MQQVEVVVIGAGQAGLAVSHELSGLGVDHVLLERGQIGEFWRNRWDSFCLVTPNWSVRLPGFPYDGRDPDGFMPRDEIVEYLQRYAGSFGSPVQEHVQINSLAARDGEGFGVETISRSYKARSLVLATGAYQRPHRPRQADGLPTNLLRIDVEDYSNPQALPSGRVLIIGSGQSGCQIAEELHASGREVVLACGRAPWAPRRIGDRDVVWWLLESGFFDAPFSSLPGPEARLYANSANNRPRWGPRLASEDTARQGRRPRGPFSWIRRRTSTIFSGFGGDDRVGRHPTPPATGFVPAPSC